MSFAKRSLARRNSSSNSEVVFTRKKTGRFRMLEVPVPAKSDSCNSEISLHRSKCGSTFRRRRLVAFPRLRGRGSHIGRVVDLRCRRQYAYPPSEVAAPVLHGGQYHNQGWKCPISLGQQAASARDNSRWVRL